MYDALRFFVKFSLYLEGKKSLPYLQPPMKPASSPPITAGTPRNARPLSFGPLLVRCAAPKPAAANTHHAPATSENTPSTGVYQASPVAPVLTSFRASLRRPLRGGFAVLDRRQQTEKPLFMGGNDGNGSSRLSCVTKPFYIRSWL